MEVKIKKPMPIRCKDCRSHFSVKKCSAMQSSKIGLQKRVVAIYRYDPSIAKPTNE